jgi:hypothetical protein
MGTQMNNEDKAWLDNKLKQDTDKAWQLKELHDRLESARIQCTQHHESASEWQYARDKVAELQHRIYVLNNGKT